MSNTPTEPHETQLEQDKKAGGLGRAISWCGDQAKRPFKPEAIETPNGRFVRTWHPTKKWWTGVITALGAFATNWIQAGQFNTEIQIALVSVVVAAMTSYVAGNDLTPGGYHGTVENSGGAT